MTKFWFDHLHLVVLDPVKTAQFYVRVFGAEQVGVVNLPDGRLRVNLNINGGRMLINTPRPSEQRKPDSPRDKYGAEHFGMKVDDLEDALKICKGAGGQIVQDITESRPGVRYAFVMAPDDVLIELVEMK